MHSDDVPAIAEVRLEVAGLGVATGISLNNEVCQYLGIPYGEIPGRFRRSVPAKAPWENGRQDGTKFGPCCPQPMNPVTTAVRPWLEMPAEDELKCLNLNISVPYLPSQMPKKGMPVMVYIHGGALTYGSNASTNLDGRMLAWASAHRFSKPVIVVTINYRVGVYGFLAGHDLEKFNKTNSEAGVGNNGIWDQVLALRWINKHIASFGGDPDRVTLLGQSAGSASAHCHLLRHEQLFSSIVLMSGLVRLCGVLSIDEYQVVYEKILQEIGAPPGAPAHERLEWLLAADSDKLTAAMIAVSPTPVITTPLCNDGVLVPEGLPTDAMTGATDFKLPEWCPRLIIGDTRNETIVWNHSWNSLSQTPMSKDQAFSTPDGAALLRKIDAVLGAEKCKLITELYGVKKHTGLENVFWAVEKLTTDGKFLLPNYVAETTARRPGAVFAYHLDVPSPLDNPWKGLAHHNVDYWLIFGNNRHLLPRKHQEIGDVMAEAWLKFVHGDDPWENFAQQQRWMIFTEEETSLKTRGDDEGRGYEVWDRLLEAGMVNDLADISDELCLGKSALVKSLNIVD